MPKGQDYSKPGGRGGTASFWNKHRIKDSHSQPGNRESGGYDRPSEKISPKKAKKILKHGSVRGHKLTPKQKGMFGAAAGRSGY